MSNFGESSLKVFETLHSDLQLVLVEAIKSTYFDFSLIDGARSNDRQDELYFNGDSKAKAGESAHNCENEDGEPESQGVDIIPYPSGYSDGQAMLLLAGHIISTAERLGIDIVCGCDWDRDGQVMDTNFKDFWHFELMHWRQK